MSFSCFVRRETRYHTHAHTYREDTGSERKRGRVVESHSHMHNLLVTHAKYVENETTCLGSEDVGDVRAKLLG